MGGDTVCEGEGALLLEALGEPEWRLEAACEAERGRVGGAEAERGEGEVALEGVALGVVLSVGEVRGEVVGRAEGVDEEEGARGEGEEVVF
jgi:hypothetical protein